MDTLTRAVIRQLGGRESLADVARTGADGGFPGFTYYADTVRFAKRHKAAILERLARDADAMGERSVAALVTSFRCVNATEDEVARVLYGAGGDADVRRQVLNALAWYALEEVAREQEDA